LRSYDIAIVHGTEDAELARRIAAAVRTIGKSVVLAETSSSPRDNSAVTDSLGPSAEHTLVLFNNSVQGTDPCGDHDADDSTGLSDGAVRQFMLGVPKTPQERSALASERPPMWKFLLFASHLEERFAGLDWKWQNHQARYAHRTGERVDRSNVVRVAGHYTDSLKVIIERIGSIDAGASWALSDPSEPGDPARLEKLAAEMTDVYDDMMNWAAEVRGVDAATPDSGAVMETLAELIDSPMFAYRSFLETFIGRASDLPNDVAAGRKVDLSFGCKLDLDPFLMNDLVRAMKNVVARR
jgi:hypothetical protein